MASVALVLASVGLYGVLLSLLGLFWTWVGFGAAGVVLAFALRYALDRLKQALCEFEEYARALR